MLSKAEHLVGKPLAGYRLLDIFGRGGMSIVFVAERLDNPKARVAIKVLMPSHVTTPEECIASTTSSCHRPSGCCTGYSRVCFFRAYANRDSHFTLPLIAMILPALNLLTEVLNGSDVVS
jgi:serine/threonine protein kinase